MAVKRRLRFSGHAKYETGLESEIWIWNDDQTAISTVLHPSKYWERFVVFYCEMYTLGKNFPSH